MTMPIQFDTAAYIKVLVDAGVPPEHASAHAIALAHALSQPVANDSDLTIVRAEMHAMISQHETRMKQWVMAQLKPIYWLLGLIVVLQTITMTKLFL